MSEPVETTSAHPSKADEIMLVGQELMQTHGYDGFSYRDVAARVGIKSATIHYYFPAKADLALAVARKYRSEFASAVDDLTAQRPDPVDQLVGFAEIFQSTLEDQDRVCLCGMLASESSSLPDVVLAETAQFFREQEAWISATLAEGVDSGTINDIGPPDILAKTILSALEGAMIVARSMGRPEHLDDVSSQLVALLRPESTVS